MVIQVGLPLNAEGSTTPPTGPGDWTITSTETAYVNTSQQALIQGNINVYGDLIVDGGSLFIWGSSDGQRTLRVYNGGSLTLTNGGVISSYTSVCTNIVAENGASFIIDDGRIQEACYLDLQNLDWSIENAHFEDSILRLTPPSAPLSYSNGTTYLNWTFDNVDFSNLTRRPAMDLTRYNMNSWSTIARTMPMEFTNLTIEVEMYDRGNTNDNTVEVDWDLPTTFRHVDITDQSYANRSSDYPNVGYRYSNSGGTTYPMFPSLFAVLRSNLLELENITAHDSHEHGFLVSSSIPVLMDDVSIERVLEPIIHPSFHWYNSANNVGLGLNIIQQDASILIISNLSVKDSGIVNFISSSGYHRGVDFQCNVISGKGIITISNTSIDRACQTSYTYSQYNPINSYSYSSSFRSNQASDCDGGASATNTLKAYTSWENGLGNADTYCRLHSAFVIYSGNSNKLTINDVSIVDSAYANVHFSYTSSSQVYYRHSTTFASVVYSEGGGEITNLTTEGSGNASTTSAYQDTSQHLNAFSYGVVLEGSSSTVLYLNDSNINHSSVTPVESASYFKYQDWYATAASTGTLVLTNTNLTEATCGFILGTSWCNDGMVWLGSSGEFLRKWSFDVRVVDPDGVFTPNATVNAYENSIWHLGTRTTGSNGSLVTYIGTQYSLTRSSNYSYTPHSIAVTLTNYSNSSSFNLTGPTSIIVYDPTPDAFPGDITQDWDNDSDGYGDNISGNNPDYFPSDSTQWNDTDGDGYGDNQSGNNPDRLPNDSTQWQDADGDGYGDNQSGNNPDRLPNDATQWQDADGDGYGDNPNGNNADAFTSDSTQWADLDGDGYGDNASGNNPDAFINDATQWSDTDGDGYGDNQSGNNPDAFPLDMTQWYDGDGDGLGDNQSGNNSDPYVGDSDNDGYSNSVDAFPWNPTQFEDLDNDGLGDNTSGTAADPYPDDTDNDGTNNTLDPFPTDATQDTDADGDGYGDNQSGNNPDPSLDDSDNDGVTNSNDDFPYNPTQTSDSDGDGWGDNQSGHPADAFPNEPSQWLDSDGDGYGDNANGVNGDAFPYDSTQWSDADGDGYGDNPTGTLPDEYPNDPSQWVDADGDGYGDNYTFTIDSTTGLRVQSGDPFPLDSTQWSDLDGDGHGDNASGNLADEYPYDHTQWRDRDSDSFPDNYSYSVNSSTGLRENQIGDAFPDDATQWSDVDGDGYGDNASGNNADVFPTDSTQWADADNDGLGDNPNGNNPDPTPGDTDNDGVPDYLDAFPYEATQWSDTDGDGYGDNWGATTWTSLRSPGLPGMFVQNAVLVDYFPTISAAHLDSDFDGFPDNWGPQDTGNNRAGLILDVCPQIYGNATTAGPGCPDGDGDNVADQDDAFPIDPTQWSDSDGDGYGDNQDGSFPDRFPDDPNQCCDRDGDGYGDNASSNPHDKFPDNPTQWNDSDGDGYGDNPQGTNPDMFPTDSTQWLDADGDGYGDDPNGTNPDPYLDDSDNDGYPDGQDDCPSVYGNSTYDRKGCVDSDADGVSDQVDLWPNDPSRSLDSDGDDVNDPDDAFPDDATQWVDADNDGLGDNPNGNNPDPSLDDTDNDGYLNQNDIFPEDPTQWQDLDGDGLGDNPEGSNPDPSPNDSDNDGVMNPEDLYPLNPDQHSDSDGDGWGDNPFGLNGDAFPSDPTQCCDTDGDGWGDNPNGTMPDAFPLDSTQWMDLDNDGLGDNPEGSNGDPSPNDTDNDGIKNGEDGWPNDPEKSLDSDGDGIEDGDELFLMTKIPSTSAGSVMLLVLLVSIATGIGGYLFGQRNSTLSKGSDLRENEPYDAANIVEQELGENEL
ncbi:hypothetical protein N9V58_00870 [Candidatus Poseidoniales archaeon]|nr:hypothetical protein [Candidatus Poseidoniales archaeon]